MHPVVSSDEADQYRQRRDESVKRLAPILDGLPGPVDYAVAYGSGVMKQANATGVCRLQRSLSDQDPQLMRRSPLQ